MQQFIDHTVSGAVGAAVLGAAGVAGAVVSCGVSFLTKTKVGKAALQVAEKVGALGLYGEIESSQQKNG